MLRRITNSIFYGSIIISFFLPQQLRAKDYQNAYINKEWDFQINIPYGWYYTEGKQIVEQIKELCQESHELVQKSAVIVNISEYPFGSKVDFNPNINISARNVVTAPQLVTEGQLIERAEKLLLSLSKSGNTSDIQRGNVNGLISISSEYEYRLQSSKGTIDISNLSTIIISKSINNYFIITATCKKEDKEKYFAIFNTEIASFKEGTDD